MLLARDSALALQELKAWIMEWPGFEEDDEDEVALFSIGEYWRYG